MSKLSKLDIENTIISITKVNEDDFICLTDMAKAKQGDNRAADIIKTWLRSRTTIEFLGTWETMYNPSFNKEVFAYYKSEAGLPTFVLSPKQWAEKTNAIGIISKSGRYGGTYAHRDIAFEFGSAISPTFKLYLIKEYQRFKAIESNQYNIEWNVKRILSKANYHIQTDAVKNYILPKKNYTKNTEWLSYAEEADLLNVALFNCTAKDWREANTELTKKGMNIRDIASINELVVLSNLENLNALMIERNIDKLERYNQLRKTALSQIKTLDNKDFIKSLKKLTDKTFIDEEKRLKDE